MILPGNSFATLLVLVVSMLCWGVWANTFKAGGGKWRFELYYFDVAIGVLLASVLYALTLGSFGFDGFSVMDDLRLAGKRQDAVAFLAGMIFNLGNMFLMAGLSLSGLSVAFPIGMGTALALGIAWSFVLGRGGNAALLMVGMAVLIGAIVLAVLAFREYALMKLQAAVETGKTKSTRLKVSLRAAVLSVVGGLLIGSFSPLLQMATAAESGLGPYTGGVLFALGLFFSTFVFNLFFMTLPVEGKPVEIRTYMRARGGRHLRGILGGVLLYTAVLGGLVALRAQDVLSISPALAYGLGQAGVLVAAICGIWIWKEFEGADTKVRMYLMLMLILLALGIGAAATASMVRPA